ncbi:MAG: hypothetical protein ABSF46_08850 [Terriglobia bacterium]
MNATNARPDFSGVWELNVERSTLRGSGPRRIVMEIEHREPRLVQQIHLTNADGAEKRVSFAYETGAETTKSVGGAPARTLARWEGDELVIESRMMTPCREVYFRDHWSLSDDGRTLTMAYRDDDLAGQISILEKGSPSESSPS